MKISHILLFAAIIGVTLAADCPVFTCGEVPQDGDSPKCGGTLGEGDDKHFIFQTCPDVEAFGLPADCYVRYWNNPVQATESIDCSPVAFISLYPSAVSLDEGGSFDGDVCGEDSHCYEGTCGENYACESHRSKGEACEAGADGQCPVGSYCNADNVCGEPLSTGDVCPRDGACPIGHGCIKVGTDDDADFRCTRYHSLNHGDVFEHLPYANNPIDLTKEGKKDATRGVEFSLYCSTLAAISKEQDDLLNTIYQCRNADRNENQNHLVEGGSGVDCKVATFSDPDFANFNYQQTRTTVSLCGFNKDARGVCPLQIGDDISQELFHRAAKAHFYLPCHQSSNDGKCAALLEAKRAEVRSRDLENSPLFGANIFLQTADLGFSDDFFGQLFANIANNDECVARAVTQDFWNGFDISGISFDNSESASPFLVKASE